MKNLYKILILFVMFSPVYSRESMAPYLLDGSLVLYFPTIADSAQVWQTIYEKTKGVEAVRSTSRIAFLIRDRLGANILDPAEAESMGVDSLGSMAYVYLNKDLMYAVFTVKNEELLISRLSALDTPIPYRIEGEYVILSASIEILEYYNFQGFSKNQEFKQITQQISFDWKQNFIWMDSSYFVSRNLLNLVGVVPQGNRIAGTYSVDDRQMYFDMITIYDDAKVIQEIKNSLKVTPVQRTSLLDFENGDPAIVGQLYLELGGFIEMILAIDRENTLGIKTLLENLQKNGVDLQGDLIPYLRGRLSYIVRAYKPAEGVFDFSMTAELANKGYVNNLIRNVVQQQRSKGVQILFKNLFTQQFYGWKLKQHTFWVGIVEDHLVIATDEANLTQLVQNIYQNKKGFLERLPQTFQRSIRDKIVGGQFYMQNPSFIQNMSFSYNMLPISFVSAIRNVKWDFYFVNFEDKMGRRDIVTIQFIN